MIRATHVLQQRLRVHQEQKRQTAWWKTISNLIKYGLAQQLLNIKMGANRKNRLQKFRETSNKQ